MVTKHLKWTLTTLSFSKSEHAVGKNWPFSQENLFRPKEHLKMAYFCVHESGLIDVGRLRTPNPLHQAVFSGTPEILRVWRFKWAMWKVRGIKIERTPLWYFFPRLVKRPTCKSNFGRWNSTPKTRELYFNLTRTSIKRCVLIILCRDWFLLFVFSQAWEISVYIMSNSGGTSAYIHYSLRLLDAVCSAHLPNIICWCQFL